MCNEYSKEPKFFGRRKGRVVRKAKSFLLDSMLPQLRITEAKEFDAVNMFGQTKKEICLEIGFGDGQHIYGQAKNNPDIGYVGVEVFQNGVDSLHRKTNIPHYPNWQRMLVQTELVACSSHAWGTNIS